MGHRLFFDITELAAFDKGTGIQRTTRALLQSIKELSLGDWEIIPVRGDGKLGRFLKVESIYQSSELENKVEPNKGDIYLGVDLIYNITPKLRQELHRYRSLGVGIYFVIYDLIPLMHPEWFEGTNEWFEGNDYLNLFSYWFDCVVELSDGLLCISKSVQRDVDVWIRNHKAKRTQPPKMAYFYLGSDISQCLPSIGLPAEDDKVLSIIRSSISFLMVGTLEPRKGHELALSAIERLWSMGENVNLVIVGRVGWKVDNLVERIKMHPRLGTNLIWLPNISDEFLREVYASSTTLLALSLAEGFGLPLVEAAYFGLPLIVRDIPVFREICGTSATYFNGVSSEELYILLQEWLNKWKSGAVFSLKKMPILTWNESARQLLSVIATMRGLRY